MKHKHADLIHAWADGAVIQAKYRDLEDWVDDHNPYWWSHDFKFRIKPEEKKPVVRWLWATDEGCVSSNMYKKAPTQAHTIKLEWSRTEFPE